MPNKLPGQMRHFYVMKAEDQLTVKEIASQLQLREQTVKNLHTFYARYSYFSFEIDWFTPDGLWFPAGGGSGSPLEVSVVHTGCVCGSSRGVGVVHAGGGCGFRWTWICFTPDGEWFPAGGGSGSRGMWEWFPAGGRCGSHQMGSGSPLEVSVVHAGGASGSPLEMRVVHADVGVVPRWR